MLAEPSVVGLPPRVGAGEGDAGGKPLRLLPQPRPGGHCPEPRLCHGSKSHFLRDSRRGLCCSCKARIHSLRPPRGAGSCSCTPRCCRGQGRTPRPSAPSLWQPCSSLRASPSAGTASRAAAGHLLGKARAPRRCQPSNQLGDTKPPAPDPTAGDCGWEQGAIPPSPCPSAAGFSRPPASRSPRSLPRLRCNLCSLHSGAISQPSSSFPACSPQLKPATVERPSTTCTPKIPPPGSYRAFLQRAEHPLPPCDPQTHSPCVQRSR